MVEIGDNSVRVESGRIADHLTDDKNLTEIVLESDQAASLGQESTCLGVALACQNPQDHHRA